MEEISKRKLLALLATGGVIGGGGILLSEGEFINNKQNIRTNITSFRNYDGSKAERANIQFVETDNIVVVNGIIEENGIIESVKPTAGLGSRDIPELSIHIRPTISDRTRSHLYEYTNVTRCSNLPEKFVVAVYHGPIGELEYISIEPINNKK